MTIYSLSMNALYLLYFLILACLTLVKSPGIMFILSSAIIDHHCHKMFHASVEWYEKQRARKKNQVFPEDNGRLSDDSVLIFCMFDKGPLILFTGTGFALCTAAVVGCSLVLGYY